MKNSGYGLQSDKIQKKDRPNDKKYKKYKNSARAGAMFFLFALGLTTNAASADSPMCRLKPCNTVFCMLCQTNDGTLSIEPSKIKGESADPEILQSLKIEEPGILNFDYIQFSHYLKDNDAQFVAGDWEGLRQSLEKERADLEIYRAAIEEKRLDGALETVKYINAISRYLQGIESYNAGMNSYLEVQKRL